MTLRATTHDQFRIVLKWVKEHPVLARGDNEVEKGGRELKNKLWEKLTIELNDIGPPVRTWMAWKRVLTDYKYSLKKKIQRRIANASQGGTEVLASLNDLETEALHASLLDWDFSEIEKLVASEIEAAAAAAADDSKTSQPSSESTEEANPQPQDLQQSKTELSPQQTANGSSGTMDAPNMNGNIESSIPVHVINGNGEIPIGNGTSSENLSLPDAVSNSTVENGPELPNTTYTSAPIVESAEDLSKTAASYIKSEDGGTNEALNMTTFPASEALPNLVDSLTQRNDTPNTSTSSVAAAETLSSQQPMLNEYTDLSVINAALAQQSLTPQQLAQYQSQLATQNALQSSHIGPATSYLQAQLASQSEQAQSLTPEEMNMLIAREIDRMATAQKQPIVVEKTRKTQRKRPEKPLTGQPPTKVPKSTKEKSTKIKRTPKKVQLQAQSQQPPQTEYQIQTQLLQQQLQHQHQQQQQPTTSQPKKMAAKRPTRPNKLIKDGKISKRFVSGREFRHCLLALLTEANEMEKRRIAITETKVRNQTEIQNLEITRMNLEIMKLQKEITLLDHGAKILP